MTQPDRPQVMDPAQNPTLLRQAAQTGANWFYWIAGLSMVNAVILACGGRISFIMGLSYTYFAVGFFSEFGQAGPALSLCGAAAISGIFALIGYQAVHLKLWAWVTGILLYVSDGVIYYLLEDYWSTGFHGLALFFIISGWSCMNRLKKLEGGSVRTSPQVNEN